MKSHKYVGQARILIKAERFCKHQAKSFSDDAEVLELRTAFLEMLRGRAPFKLGPVIDLSKSTS